ncbi:MAG: serine/threonine-protein kinase [Fibrobacteria bacterium]
MIPKLPKAFSHPMIIGEGSFSSVYRVRQKSLDRWVAVKIINEKNAARRHEVLSEARNQAQMPIACIPSVFDAFQLGQRVFIIMEWVKGATLLSLLEKGIPNKADRAAIGFGIISALAGLHKLGFAHRDLKPANILVTPEAGIYLVDFGFSKKIGESGQSIVGMVKGTPAYMAPEIWQGAGSPDFMKADLFALGKILQELDPAPEWKGISQPLMSLDPNHRPDSAVVLWDRCQSLPISRMTQEGKASVNWISSELLSRRLLQAAKQLLFAKRSEEAYWLLAECLQEDPDAAEAMQLLETFPALSKEKKRRQWVISMATAAGFIVAMLLAFHYGKSSERGKRYVSVSAEENSKILLLPGMKDGKRAVKGAAKFLELATVENSLMGLIFIEGAEQCDKLSLDGRVVRTPAPSGLPTASGEHVLLCNDRFGSLNYREKLTILPFQRKIIRIHDKVSKKEA